MRVAAGCLVLAWLAVLSCYDVAERRLPDALTLTGAAVILTAATAAGRGTPALVGAAALTALYLLIHLVAPSGKGAGDVKLALGLGALTGCFGAPAWFLAALGAPLLTVLLGLALMPWRTGPTVPHGPSMCLASAAGIGLVLP